MRDFVSDRELGCQTDNLCTRMLLGSNRLISETDFIQASDDEALVSQAFEALKEFVFIDIIENPELVANLQTWLGRPIAYRRVNETGATPETLSSVLYKELTPEFFSLLEERTRLDMQLWFAVASDRVTDSKLNSLYARTLLFNAARSAALLAPPAVHRSLTSEIP